MTAKDFMGRVDSAVLPSERKGFMLIPVKCRHKLSRDNVVFFMVDFKNKGIEYYDPQGQALNSNSSIQGFFSELCNSIAVKERIDQSSYSVDRDQHCKNPKSSGIFVLEFMKKRLEIAKRDDQNTQGEHFQKAIEYLNTADLGKIKETIRGDLSDLLIEAKDKTSTG